MHSLSARVLSWSVLTLAAVQLSRAEVQLPALFTDHMVLQRNEKITVWGTAAEKETVKVTFQGKTVTATPKDGNWSVRLPKQKAGGPYKLVVEGRNRIEIQDVLVGDVWVCSGQSNMEWPLRAATDGDKAAKAGTNPNIRLFTVPKLKSDLRVKDVRSKWQECTPENLPAFSAVGYFFGRDLQPAVGVPIGLIHTSWGGSPAEVWLSPKYLAENPRWREEILGSYDTARTNYFAALAKYERESAQLMRDGKKVEKGAPQLPFWKPAELYNGMIAPLLKYPIKGAIWYQGESNAGRAKQYRSLITDMIKNWRQDWNVGNFTFLQVQLAPFDRSKKRTLEQITATPVESDWAELREAQTLATEWIPNVGMAVITDVGEKDDIHPKQKEVVGARLALAARSIAYGQKIVASGPKFKAVTVNQGKAEISFSSTGKGLEARGGDLNGFAVAGPDGKFVWAKAEIAGDKVIVSNPQVTHPMSVRYGWADFPVVNLYNKDGLPALPFRTDDWKMVTEGKK